MLEEGGGGGLFGDEAKTSKYKSTFFRRKTNRQSIRRVKGSKPGIYYSVGAWLFVLFLSR